MFSIINVMKKQTLLYRLRTYGIRKRSRFEFDPQSTICSYASAITTTDFYVNI